MIIESILTLSRNEKMAIKKRNIIVNKYNYKYFALKWTQKRVQNVKLDSYMWKVSGWTIATKTKGKIKCMISYFLCFYLWSPC